MTLCGIALADSDIIVGNGSGLGADVPMSGDVTIDDTGKTTIQRTAGQSSRPSCRVATTAALTATYANGSSGVGAALTNSGTKSAITIDGMALSANDRVLVKDQATAAQNGIYTVTTVGSGSVNWVLTRATDFNTASSIGVVEGAFTVVAEGTANSVTFWVETGAGPFTIGTTAITFSPLTGTSGIITVSQQHFTSSGTYTPSAGMVYCIAEVIGGGGGGGGSSASAGTGGGGGAGGDSRSRLTAAQVGASKTVTIGAGGAGGASFGGHNGGAGGDTSIGTLVIGKGGAGGVCVGGAGGAGGVSGTGDIKFIGNVGNSGATTADGGAGAFGGGGKGAGAGAATAGSNYGSGGGGGGGWGGTSSDGAAGSAGIVIITEYCTS